MNRVKRTGLLFFICCIINITPQVRLVSFNELQQEAALKNNDTLYVVNFWATWCDPCVKELPAFQAEYKKFASHKVKMIFVSLNSAKEMAKVQKFADDKGLKPEVLVLSGGNPNEWIDKVDSSWGGSLPATVIYRHGKKLYFHEGDFTQDNLNSIIQSNLNKL